MIITRLGIRNFGKVKDLRLEFGDKLNVIYGTNEAGKTTILAFIKAMLYGMASRRRDIRGNDRLRFQPWGGEFGEGELYFRDENNREILLRRKLGNDRRDILQVTDVLTGRRITSYERNCPGQAILGLGEAAFARTVYVPQLGCTVQPDKDDEIMARLMNLQQTGEERVSLQKALNSLEKDRKRITLRSGNGLLDNLRNTKFSLLQERVTAQKLHDGSIAERSQLNGLRESLALTEKELALLEEKRYDLKKYRQYLEYEEIRIYREKVDSLEKDLEEAERLLLCGERRVDDGFLQEIRLDLLNLRGMEKQSRDLEKDAQEKSKKLQEIEALLRDFTGFGALEADTETQVLLEEKNKESLEEKLALLAKQRREMAVLEEELKNAGQVYDLRRDLAAGRLKLARCICLGGLTVAAAGIITGLHFHPLGYAFCVIGALAGVFGYLRTRKQKALLASIEEHPAPAGGEGSGAGQLARLTAEEEERLCQELQRCSAYLHNTLAAAGCSCVREFREKMRTFSMLKNDKENLCRETEDLRARREQLDIAWRGLMKAICSRLHMESAGRGGPDQAEEAVREYEERLARQKELAVSLEARRKVLRERLAGREWADIETARQWEIIGLSRNDMEEEELLDQRIAELNREKIRVVREITALEGRIKSSLQGSRDISAIEEDLEQVVAQIKHYEEILAVLDLTKDMLSAAFEELQNSFGPLLNNKVGRILETITKGKYSEVNVAENYGIVVKDKACWGREAEFFSNGTLDQVYFALRMGLMDLVFDGGEKPPLILDETFVQYDEERLAAVLEYLCQVAERQQVLLFTCHRREGQILQGKDFHYISLEDN